VGDVAAKLEAEVLDSIGETERPERDQGDRDAELQAGLDGLVRDDRA
jgi:hypothetical protein